MIGLKALMERARLMARRIEYDGRCRPDRFWANPKGKLPFAKHAFSSAPDPLQTLAGVSRVL